MIALSLTMPVLSGLGEEVQAMKIHGELVKLRDERITRFIGLSAHGYFDKALALIESGGFDQCMLSYGYIPRGYDQIWTAG